MTRTIYARTRYDYDSYQDFWRLVELAGLPTCYVDEIDVDADGVYVTTPMTGELKSRKLPKPRRAKVVWWNLERPDGGEGSDFKEVVTQALSHVDEVWVSDRYYQTLDSRMRFVPMGSHPGLATQVPPNFMVDRAWDVAHLSYVNYRRSGIYGPLKHRLAPNAWGVIRAAVLQNSQVFLNVHQTAAPVSEPLRFALAAAYKCFLLSETCADAYPLQDGDLLQGAYDDLPRICGEMVKLMKMRGDLRAEYGERLHRRLCDEWRFPRGAAEAVRQLLAERGLTS